MFVFRCWLLVVLCIQTQTKTKKSKSEEQQGKTNKEHEENTIRRKSNKRQYSPCHKKTLDIHTQLRNHTQQEMREEEQETR